MDRVAAAIPINQGETVRIRFLVLEIEADAEPTAGIFDMMNTLAERLGASVSVESGNEADVVKFVERSIAEMAKKKSGDCGTASGAKAANKAATKSETKPAPKSGRKS